MQTPFLRAVLGGLLVLGLTTSAALLPQGALAAGPARTTNGGAPHQMTGVVEYLDPAKDSIVISDRGMSIGSGTPVHVGGRSTGRFALRQGMRVAYKATAVKGGRPAISEIWILSNQ